MMPKFFISWDGVTDSACNSVVNLFLPVPISLFGPEELKEVSLDH